MASVARMTIRNIEDGPMGLLLPCTNSLPLSCFSQIVIYFFIFLSQLFFQFLILLLFLFLLREFKKVFKPPSFNNSGIAQKMPFEVCSRF
jgi:hypothetical protein